MLLRYIMLIHMPAKPIYSCALWAHEFVVPCIFDILLRTDIALIIIQFLGRWF